MATIYAFRGASTQRTRECSGPASVPDEVWSAVMSVVDMPRDARIDYHEIPVPPALADYGVGVSMRYLPRRHGQALSDVRDAYADAVCSDAAHHAPGCAAAVQGWVMAMFCSEPQDGWHGRWRCSAYLRFPVDTAQSAEFTAAIHWDEMRRELEEEGARDIVGAASVRTDIGFGIELPRDAGGCAIRVSWTPQMTDTGAGPDVGAQIGSWTRFMRSVAGDEEDAAV